MGMSLDDADSYPVLTGGFAPGYTWDPLEQAGLQPGDRLVRIGNADLRGVGLLGFEIRGSQEAGRDLSVPLIFERDGQRRETSLALISISVYRPMLAASFAWAVSALFLLLRAQPTPSVRAYFYVGMCGALCLGALSQSRAELFAWFVLVAIVTAAVALPLWIHFASLFPDDRAPEGRWHRIWPWLFAPPMGLFMSLSFFRGRVAVGESGGIAIVALGLFAGLAVATRKYRE